MKLLDNVRMYEIDEYCILLHFGSETETHFDGCDVRGGYIPKSKTRPLTIDEQAHYLYDLCCKPHSRFGDFADLCDFIDKETFLALCVYSRHDAHIGTILNCIRHKLELHETT